MNPSPGVNCRRQQGVDGQGLIVLRRVQVEQVRVKRVDACNASRPAGDSALILIRF
jgi:hypothetical protein